MVEKILDCINSVGTLLIGIFVIVAFICGIIGALIHKKRHGHLPKGQGYCQD